MNKKRFGNLDLLRILCALGIVIEHFCETSAHNAFGFAHESSFTAYVILYILYAFARNAVPIFFITSGYLSIHSSNQKVGKMINLFVMTVVYNWICIIIERVLNGNLMNLHRVLIDHWMPENYYLYLFCAIYAVSPFVNKMIKQISKKQYARLILVLFLMFSLWSTFIYTYASVILNGEELIRVYFTSRTGTSMGFNVANFFMLYLIGGYIRLYGEEILTSCKTGYKLCAIMVGCVGIEVIGKLYFPKLSKAFWYYDSIFVIILSVAIVCFFLRLNVRGNKILTFIGGTTYGTFLLHGEANKLIGRKITVEALVSKGFMGTIISIMIHVIGVYALAVMMTAIIQTCSKPFNKVWKKTKFYNIKLMCEE